MKLPLDHIEMHRVRMRVDAARLPIHGKRLQNARIHYGKPHICPDCYQPRHLCEHTEEWTFLRHT